MTEHDPGDSLSAGQPSGTEQSRWQQLNLTLASPDRDAVEHVAVTYLAPALSNAEAQGLITCWFFIRKQSWKLRYLPADGDMVGQADKLLHTVATRIQEARHAICWRRGIYEPETHAFGGNEAMEAAHALFHADSRHVMAHVAVPPTDRSDQRRELSILLCAALLRAAGLDRYEQGDVWAKLRQFRPDSNIPPERQNHFSTAVEQLITTDTSPGTALRCSTLHFADDWFAAFERAGKTLRVLADEGRLTRGLRAVATHHIIFHWNRIGLPARTQANIASAARQIIFGS